VYAAAEGNGVFIVDGQHRWVVSKEVCAKSAPNCFFRDAAKSP
jgi:hypothetical protein